MTQSYALRLDPDQGAVALCWRFSHVFEFPRQYALGEGRLGGLRI